MQDAERIWSNPEAVLLRRPQGDYMLVCSAGRSAILTEAEARRLGLALGEDIGPTDDVAAVFSASRRLTTEDGEGIIIHQNVTAAPPTIFKPNPPIFPRKKRPYHRKAPSPTPSPSSLSST